jgi:hypothetical protein
MPSSRTYDADTSNSRSTSRGDVPRRGVRVAMRVGVGSRCREELGGGHLLGGCGTQGHGGLREVAAVADLPLVMGFDQHGPGQPYWRLRVREHPTTSVRRLISLCSRSSGLVDQSLFQWLGGKLVKASRSSAASPTMTSSLGTGVPASRRSCSAAHAHGPRRLGEDGADGCGDHLG